MASFIYLVYILHIQYKKTLSGTALLDRVAESIALRIFSKEDLSQEHVSL